MESAEESKESVQPEQPAPETVEEKVPPAKKQDLNRSFESMGSQE